MNVRGEGNIIPMPEWQLPVGTPPTGSYIWPLHHLSVWLRVELWTQEWKALLERFSFWETYRGQEPRVVLDVYLMDISRGTSVLPTLLITSLVWGDTVSALRPHAASWQSVAWRGSGYVMSHVFSKASPQTKHSFRWVALAMVICVCSVVYNIFWFLVLGFFFPGVAFSSSSSLSQIRLTLRRGFKFWIPFSNQY